MPEVPHSNGKTGECRALLSTSTFPLAAEDGTPRFVLDLARHLTRHARVTALAPGAPGGAAREEWDGVEIRRFTYFLPRSLQSLAYGNGMLENVRGAPFRLLQVLPFLAAQTSATRSLIRANRIDVVNSHWMIPQGLSTALAGGRRRRFRHLLSVHAGDVYLLRKLAFGRRIARFILQRTDRVFADGSHVLSTLDELLGEPSDGIVQPMGVDLDLFRNAGRQENRPFEGGTLLFVGRLVEKKGTEYLLRSLPAVLERRPKLGLVLVGEGPLGPFLRRLAAELGVEDSVRFEGRCSHERIAQLLSACEVAVVPSIVDQYGETEGMPTTVLEAMAAGCSVVGSAVDGIPDIIRHGENGWLSRPKDPEDLSRSILTALDYGRREPSVRDAALETARHHSWANVAARYAAEFERLGSAVER